MIEIQSYTRSELLSKLKETRRKDELIIAAGAGSGLSAKFEERGGADLLLVFNSGKYRMDGHGSLSGLLAFGNANEIALEMGKRQILPVVKSVPVICSINATDPTYNLDILISKVLKLGFSGINNFPTVGLIDGKFRQALEATGLGYYKEVELVRRAQERDVFSMVYVFNEEEAKEMAEAGADVIIVHVGLTTGGSIGDENALTIEEAAIITERITKTSKDINPNLFILAHGGPLSLPSDLKKFIEIIPSIDGFIGASSMERIPTEKAITQTVQEFKQFKNNSY